MSLLQRVRDQSRRALASETLYSIETTAQIVEDGGIRFIVRVISNLKRKSAAAGDPHDPFQPPYEPDLYVADIGTAHVALLNKYNVLPDHLLIVTRDYEAQTDLLNRRDMAALLTALGEIDGLGFYNGGAEAGASQPHKHLQLVPRPLADVGPPIPFETVFDRRALSGSAVAEAELPFHHAVTAMQPAWWQEPQDGADAACEAYRTLLRACGLPADGPAQSAPYNLLLTRRWMWLVPRTRHACEGVAVNALGFAGALLVSSEAQRATLQRLGPLRVLAGVAPPRR